MASRDERGNYVNEEGVVIKASEYKDGSGVKIDFYDKDPSDPTHKSIHTHIKNDGTYSTESNVSGEAEKASGGCYLASACMEHFKDKFDDNCYELTVLRWFRDNFVDEADIEHYYKIAPSIVGKINKEEKSGLIYDNIYDNIVDYCVTEIEMGNYMNAYCRYKESILSLENYYIRQDLNNKLVRTLKKLV